MKKLKFKKAMTTPVAKVYRKAAEMVATGEEWYPCMAIMVALRKYFPVTTGFKSKKYLQQTKLMGQYVGQYQQAMHGEDGRFPRDLDLSKTVAAELGRVQELTTTRAASLLLMAAVCEMG